MKSSKFMSGLLIGFMMLGSNMAFSASAPSTSASHPTPSFSSPPSHARETPSPTPSSGMMGLTRPNSSPAPQATAPEARKPETTVSSPGSSMGLTRPNTPDVSKTEGTKPSALPDAPNTGMMGLTRPNSGQPNSTAPTVAQTPANLPANNLGLSRPVTPVPAVAANDNRKPPMTEADKAVTARMSSQSLASYRADQNRAKQPPMPVDATQAKQNPTFTQATGQYTSMDSYYGDRNRSMEGFRAANQNTVVVVQNMHPNYGVWDALFLAAIFSHPERSDYSDWAYSHRSDPSVEQFRREAEENGALKAQLAQMNSRMSQMEASNAHPSANLPSDINPAMAIAPEAMSTSASIQMASNPFQTTGKPAPLPDVPAKKGMSIFTMLLIGVVLIVVVVVALRYLRPRRVQ